MRKAIIVDIDGTLANNTHRRHWVEQEPKNWKRFNELMHLDTVNEWCASLCRQMQNFDEHNYSTDFDIVFVTGRHEEYRDITEALISKARIFSSDTVLLMRSSGDSRTDYIVKKEIYDNQIKGKYEILFCVDDRKQVVDMWRREGLVVLQCEEGNF